MGMTRKGCNDVNSMTFDACPECTSSSGHDIRHGWMLALLQLPFSFFEASLHQYPKQSSNWTLILYFFSPKNHFRHEAVLFWVWILLEPCYLPSIRDVRLNCGAAGPVPPARLWYLFTEQTTGPALHSYHTYAISDVCKSYPEHLN